MNPLEEPVSYFKKTGLLPGLDVGALERIAATLRTVLYRAGGVVVKEGSQVMPLIFCCERTGRSKKTEPSLGGDLTVGKEGSPF